jgi:hypothetical protein
VVALPRDTDGAGRGALWGPFWNSAPLQRVLASGRFVVGSRCKHTETEEGSERQCSRFGQVVCDQHREIEKQVVARWFDGNDPPLRPAFLVVRGNDGVVLARRLGEVAAAELADVIGAAALSAENAGDGVVPSEWLAKAGDPDAGARARALRILASLEGAGAEGALRKRYDEAKDDLARIEILGAVADAGARTLAASAIEALEAKAVAVRTAAARAVGGSASAAAVDPLLRALAKAREDDERRSIVRALGRCGRTSEAAKEALRKAVHDGRALQRANACVALAEAADADPLTQKLLRQRIETDSEARVRGAAAYALVSISGTADAKDLVTFLRARKAKEKDPKVAEMLASGVAMLDGSLAEPPAWALKVFCGDAK